MILSLFRVVKFATQQITRNLWFSVITVTMLVLPLISVNLIIALAAVGNAASRSIQDKVDVSVYFKSTVSNEDAQGVRTALLGMSEVASIQYIPKEGSLDRFKKRHASDPVILESLEQLGENPFGATLAIKAKTIDSYSTILKVLEQKDYNNLIEEKNFEDHRATINRINDVIKNVRTFGFAVAAIFGTIAVLIVVNSIRIAIYTHRDEVRVMKLVGAGNTFVRGPFLVKGFFLSIAALVVTLLIVYPALNLIQPYTNNLFQDMDLNLVRYFNQHFIVIFGLQLLGVVFLSTVSSSIALRRYLKV